MRAAILQMTSSDDPEDNAQRVTAMLEDAAGEGADMAFTPEVTNCVSLDRAHQNDVLSVEGSDPTLAHLRGEAERLGLWLHIGSLAVKSDPPETRFANRSFLIDPGGGIAARYDKLHMFDVAVSDEETYRESAGFAPGDKAVLAQTPHGALGMTICYDLRFPGLYRTLAQAGAEIFAIPAAFSPGTGPAHWQPLLQARAIETGAFVIAAAQTGTHSAQKGRARKTYGHTMVVSPWGEVRLDAGVEPGVHVVEIDLSEVAEARRKIPSLTHDRAFARPGP